MSPQHGVKSNGLPADTFAPGVASIRAYDVAPGGQRFLMIKDAADQRNGSASLVVQLNLAEYLAQRLPAK